MTSLYLVRHGDYTIADPGGGAPRLDAGLSELGRAQAGALARRLAASSHMRLAALYASPLPRARQTARIVADALALDAVEDADLAEWDSGNDAMPVAEFQAAWRALHMHERPFHRFRAGHETGSEFNRRVRGALARIGDRHRGHAVLVVAHAGIVEVAFNLFLDTGPESFRRAYPACGHTAITHWRHDAEADEWVLEVSNDTAHLRDGR